MDKVLNKVNKKIFVDIFACLLMAFVAMMLYCDSSFLQPMNRWVDTNCYFTIGRSMLHGKVAYLDLYDQKGPILHIVYCLMALISETTYNGVFTIEVINFALFLYFSYKTIDLFIDNRLFSLLSLILLSTFIPNSVAFGLGGSVEELNLSLFSLSLFLMLKDVNKGVAINNRSALIIGACASTTFFMKYTLCGFYLGLVIAVIVYYAINKLSLDDFKKVVISFLLGVLTIFVLVCLYLLINKSLIEMLTQYFYNNIFLYSDFNRNGLRDIWFGPLQSILDNRLYGYLIVLGVLYFVITIKKNLKPFIVLALSGIFMCMGIYCGGVYYEYYGLPICIYTILGFVALYKIVYLLKVKKEIINISYTLVVLAFYIFVAANVKPLQNIIKKEDLVQYRFAEIINEEENPTLLNYDFLDGGFYFTSKAIPNSKYYYKPNHLDVLRHKQNEVIKNKEVMFIVSNKELNNENYKQIDSYSGYYLYKLITN